MNRFTGQGFMTFAAAALVATALLLASDIAHASGSGTIVMKGKTAEMKDAYAYQHPASYDPAETMTTILVCDRPIDVKKVSEGDDRDKAVHAWLEETKAVYWEAILYADGTLWMTNAVWPEVWSVLGGGGRRNLDLTINDGKRIEGTYLDPNEEDKANFDADADLSDIPLLDLKFAVDVK